ncbi:hypothetical protein CTRI78_v005197 [Colletotrichum trifolii]|uniref:Uncharacterized protein n=1 Tax=Colletotrichum trifolii TaxID=5466 RepID=A0A4R8RF54_COLTR|nr:hypothetical protein CTRI78_v005197 [Colletotrichum trifolii]
MFRSNPGVAERGGGGGARSRVEDEQWPAAISVRPGSRRLFGVDGKRLLMSRVWDIVTQAVGMNVYCTAAPPVIGGLDHDMFRDVLMDVVMPGGLDLALIITEPVSSVWSRLLVVVRSQVGSSDVVKLVEKLTLVGCHAGMC